MFFHFFSRWTQPLNSICLYPYKNSYYFCNYGYLGVQFFFIISGFVIFFTLENTGDFLNFWKKRVIRLLPPMFFASIFTFIVFVTFDNKNLFPSSHVASNILVSLTFIKPIILSNLFPNNNFEYINGSYWSLWLEIQFYLYASIFFYLNKKKFLNRIIILSFVFIFINYLFQNIQGSNTLHLKVSKNVLSTYTIWFNSYFNLVIFLPYFSIGMIFYQLFKNHNNKIPNSFIIKIYLTLLLIFTIYSGIYLQARFIILGMFLVFIIFIYHPKIISFMEHRFMIRIGECSYFLYLIHENIGILCIFSFGSYFLSFDIFFTLFIIVILIVCSYIFTTKIEIPLGRWLKYKLN